MAGPGDGGWDAGLRSKGLGLLSPSPLPGGEDTLRDTAGTARSTLTLSLLPTKHTWVTYHLAQSPSPDPTALTLAQFLCMA